MSVFVASKVREAALWLPRFIRECENLEGNINRIAIMYGTSKDATFAYLKHWQNTSKHKIEIYSDPFLPEEERAGHMLARIKRDVQDLLRNGTEEFYLNLDCDLVQIPKDLIARLMARQKETIAPMIWTEGREKKTFFDTYIFRKDGCQFHPYEPPGLGQTEPFTVDSVSTCYLATRKMELEGVYSNPYPPIPFYEGLRSKGYQVWVDPSVDVYHVDLERYGLAGQHLPQPHPYSYVPFIKNTGEKVQANVVGAERFQLDRNNYERWLRDGVTDFYSEQRAYLHHQYTEVQEWLAKRPLITASVKVLNSGTYLKEFLTGLYPWVDRIDIVEGAVRQHMHGANPDGSSKDNTLEIIKGFPDPQKKIRALSGKWHDKEQVQAKLLELCQSKWMLFIDADEFLTEETWQKVRGFCEANQNGEVVYARPVRFLHFFHDWQHIAYSLNPMSPWAQFGVPHPFLIWHDIPGLNFGQFHTLPYDGFGRPLWVDQPVYEGRQKVIEGVDVYHFGNAISEVAMLDKLIYEYKRGQKKESVNKDLWFGPELPPDMVIEDFAGAYPNELANHPERGVVHVKVTAVKPVYTFERTN